MCDLISRFWCLPRTRHWHFCVSPTCCSASNTPRSKPLAPKFLTLSSWKPFELQLPQLSHVSQDTLYHAVLAKDPGSSEGTRISPAAPGPVDMPQGYQTHLQPAMRHVANGRRGRKLATQIRTGSTGKWIQGAKKEHETEIFFTTQHGLLKYLIWPQWTAPADFVALGQDVKTEMWHSSWPFSHSQSPGNGIPPSLLHFSTISLLTNLQGFPLSCSFSASLSLKLLLCMIWGAWTFGTGLKIPPNTSRQEGVVATGSGIMVRYGLGEPVRIYAGNVPRWALKQVCSKIECNTQ